MNCPQKLLPTSTRHAIILQLAPVILLISLSHWSGVDYNKITDTTENIIRGVVIPIGCCFFLSLLLTWKAGWLKPIFGQHSSTNYPAVFWLIPICWFIACTCRIVNTPFSQFDTSYFTILCFSMLIVGFNEEFLFRGILAHGPRSEWKKLIYSSVGFGLFHLPNLLTGQSLQPTLFQVGYATLLGIAFYTSLRLSRTILLPIFMHATWDFAVFSSKNIPLVGSLSTIYTVSLLVILALLPLTIYSAVKQSKL